ncbi:MFS transporter [Micromonospora sicca]|uniref:MFS transporter n=1 Tax=Micromonospora sicca TaxID=2202420 RepID=A0A317CY85_9ACTN|nr:MFS transporter [Micromonospora sp. 4G51]
MSNYLAGVTHPLRLRSFRLLFLGRTVSAVGDAVVPTALALAVLRATGSTAALALVLGCAMLPRLLLLPLGGVVADRFDARRVAIGTDLARCVAQLVVGAELLGGTPSLTHIAVAAALGGVASAFAMPTASPLVAGTVEPDARQRANALMGVTANASRLLGPALAGLLIWTAGPGWAFVLDALSFALSALLLSVIRVRHVPVPRRSIRTDLALGWREVRSRDWFWSSLLAHGVWNGAAAVLLTLGPVIAVDRLGGEGVWVLLQQGGAVGMLAGSLLAARARPRRPVLVANLGLATYAAPLLLLAVGAPAGAVIAAYCLALAALGFLNPIWETVVQGQFPPQVLARVTSYDWLVSLGAMPLGYALAPLASRAWGPPVPLAVAGALVALACAGTAAVPAVRRLGWPVSAPPAPAEQVPAGR